MSAGWICSRNTPGQRSCDARRTPPLQHHAMTAMLVILLLAALALLLIWTA
jgi:hypothetical protein